MLTQNKDNAASHTQLRIIELRKKNLWKKKELNPTTTTT
jgi:hypothetical protein